jgi:hypothetical protein
MPTPPLSDDTLREAAQAYLEHGCVAAHAADALGVNRATFQHRVEKAKARGFLLSAGAMGQVERASLNPIEAKGGWIHQYDDEGKKVGTTRWSAPEIAPSARLDEIRSALEGIAPAPLVAAPPRTVADLLTAYPVPDLHLGMRAWLPETGENYDTEIAAKRLVGGVEKLVSKSEASRTALIVALGDTFDANDHNSQTPRSKHPLDTDGRFFHTAQAAITAFGTLIELAKTKHEIVRVKILPGNHDPEAYMILLFALHERYRMDPRVQVSAQPGEFFVHQHGKWLLGGHHGDKAKPNDLTGFFAAQFSRIWGETDYRHIFSGHIHHERVVECHGATVETLRAATSRNAWAVSRAFYSKAGLKAITYDRGSGDVETSTVVFN